MPNWPAPTSTGKPTGHRRVARYTLHLRLLDGRLFFPSACGRLPIRHGVGGFTIKFIHSFEESRGGRWALRPDDPPFTFSSGVPHTIAKGAENGWHMERRNEKAKFHIPVQKVQNGLAITVFVCKQREPNIYQKPTAGQNPEATPLWLCWGSVETLW